MTGKERDFTSFPYGKIQAFSVETAGTFDLEAELDLWFSGLGEVRLEFKGSSDIRQIGREERTLTAREPADAAYRPRVARLLPSATGSL